MEFTSQYSLNEKEKDRFITALMPELATLRAKAGVSQEELANFVGISRQSYGAFERCSKKMSWSTYLSLILFYDYNTKTHSTIRNIAAFPHELIKRFNDGEYADISADMLFESDITKLLETLDEQAMYAIKTVLMVEYSRCNKMSGEAVIKFFEGIDFSKKNLKSDDESTERALKNIKRKKRHERKDG